MCIICLYQKTGSRTLIGTSQLKVAILSSNPLKVEKSRVITALFHFLLRLKVFCVKIFSNKALEN